MRECGSRGEVQLCATGGAEAASPRNFSCAGGAGHCWTLVYHLAVEGRQRASKSPMPVHLFRAKTHHSSPIRLPSCLCRKGLAMAQQQCFVIITARPRGRGGPRRHPFGSFPVRRLLRQWPEMEIRRIQPWVVREDLSGIAGEKAVSCQHPRSGNSPAGCEALCVLCS